MIKKSKGYIYIISPAFTNAYGMAVIAAA